MPEIQKPSPADMVDLSEDVRIEKGPSRKKGVADPKTMDRLKGYYAIGGIDSMGKKIEHNKAFDYIDWPGERGWWLYQKDATGRYIPKGYYPDADAAKTAAKALPPVQKKPE